MSEDPELASRRVIRELQDKLGRLEDVRNALREVRGEGEAADGLVRVVVGPSGTLEDLELDPRAMRLASEELRDAIVEAAQAATADAQAKVTELMSDFAGASGESLAAGLRTGDIDIAGVRGTDLRLPNTGNPLRDAQELLRRFGG